MQHFSTKELSARSVRIMRPRIEGFDPPGEPFITENEGRIETHEERVRFVPQVSRRALFGVMLGGTAFIFSMKNAKAATNFLWAPGTSNNGLLVSALSLLTTEMNSIATGSTALSSVGGSSGLFTNSNTGQAMIGRLFLTLGAIGSALASGANLAYWTIPSYDGGSTNVEKTVSGSAQARPPDGIIPLPATTITSGWIYASAPIMVDALAFFAFGQNNTGQSFAASANVLRLAPFSMQY